jgi:hypothetical protein
LENFTLLELKKSPDVRRGIFYLPGSPIYRAFLLAARAIFFLQNSIYYADLIIEFYGMQDIQEVFNRMQVVKKKQKDIRSAYKDALNTSLEYQEISEKIKALRERKKQIETVTKQNFSKELTELDDYKIDLESDAVLLSDIALSKLMKGETVQVVDEYNNSYEPQFSVKFKKT